MKLISMTDFVLEQSKFNIQPTDKIANWHLCLNYAKFLKQPLKLEMFVPCDDDGNILDIPLGWNPSKVQLGWEREKYAKHKEKVLFEGFSPANNSFDFKTNYRLFRVKDYKTIEDFIKENRVELILTESAIKNLGL